MKNGEDYNELEEWKKRQDERDKEKFTVFEFICMILVLILVYYRFQI